MAITLIDENAKLAFNSARAVVTDAGGLNVAVETFSYQDDSAVSTYAGTASFALADNSTNYVYVDPSSGNLSSSTSGYPVDAVKLARVQTSGGAVATIVADMATFGVKADLTTLFPLNSSVPSAPPTGYVALYGRLRHGRSYLDIQSATGRDEPVQPHIGLNRVVSWIPETGTTIRTWGMPVTNVGTVSHPTLASTNLSTSVRRWRLTSAATANSASENRCAQTIVWRGNAADLGGFTVIMRVNLATLAANCRGFFGLTSATGAISTTQSPLALTNCFGFAWESGETTLRVQVNDGSGNATRVDLGANFPTNNVNAVYTMYLFSTRNGSTLNYRVLRDDTGDVADGSFNTDLPSNTTFLTVHLYMNNGGTAAAVAFDCSGVYVETDL